MTHTLRTVIQGLLLLAWFIGGTLQSHAAQGDLMTQGPASISDLIVQEQVNGRWRLATELRRDNRYRFRYTVVNRTRLRASDADKFLKVGPHKATGKFDLYYIRVSLLGTPSPISKNLPCYGGIPTVAYPEDRDQKLARGNKAVFAYFEFTWRCNTANAFALKTAPTIDGIHASVTAELDHPTSSVPLSPNQQSSLKWNIGQFCANHNQCTTRRCDTGLGSQNTHRCLANDGTGRIGEYCNHHNQCRPGLKCFPQDPTRPTWLACQR